MATTPPRSHAGKEPESAVSARLAHLEQTVEAHERELAIQLQRIAQLQADIDRIRGAWLQLKAPPTPVGETRARPSPT